MLIAEVVVQLNSYISAFFCFCSVDKRSDLTSLLLVKGVEGRGVFIVLDTSVKRGVDVSTGFCQCCLAFYPYVTHHLLTISPLFLVTLVNRVI